MVFYKQTVRRNALQIAIAPHMLFWKAEKARESVRHGLESSKICETIHSAVMTCMSELQLRITESVSALKLQRNDYLVI